MLEELYPRRDLLITTLLDSYIIDKKLEHVCNCGEMAYMTSLVLKANNVPFQSVCLRFKNKQEHMLHDNHCFCLIRTDDKKLTFKQMMAELYHPSTLIVDWWLGRCGHPKEMFNMFANFFVEDTYNTGKKVISYLNGNAVFVSSTYGQRR